MEWEFTPAQVVKGETAYRLEDFRRDLAREVALNLRDADPAEFRRSYDLIFALCYWLATGKLVEDFLATFDGDPSTHVWLTALEPHLGTNVEMLGAVMQREIMDGVEAGLPLEQAVQAVAARHDEVARTQPTESMLYC